MQDKTTAITFLLCMTLSKQDLEKTLHSGSFDETRRLIRRAAARIALRREFIRCAALYRLQESALLEIADRTRRLYGRADGYTMEDVTRSKLANIGVVQSGTESEGGADDRGSKRKTRKRKPSHRARGKTSGERSAAGSSQYSEARPAAGTEGPTSDVVRAFASSDLTDPAHRSYLSLKAARERARAREQSEEQSREQPNALAKPPKRPAPPARYARGSTASGAAPTTGRSTDPAAATAGAPRRPPPRVSVSLAELAQAADDLEEENKAGNKTRNNNSGEDNE